jgi:hypothetical protein
MLEMSTLSKVLKRIAAVGDDFAAVWNLGFMAAIDGSSSSLLLCHRVGVRALRLTRRPCMCWFMKSEEIGMRSRSPRVTSEVAVCGDEPALNVHVATPDCDVGTGKSVWQHIISVRSSWEIYNPNTLTLEGENNNSPALESENCLGFLHLATYILSQ